MKPKWLNCIPEMRLIRPLRYSTKIYILMYWIRGELIKAINRRLKFATRGDSNPRTAQQRFNWWHFCSKVFLIRIFCQVHVLKSLQSVSKQTFIMQTISTKEKWVRISTENYEAWNNNVVGERSLPITFDSRFRWRIW